MKTLCLKVLSCLPYECYGKSEGVSFDLSVNRASQPTRCLTYGCQARTVIDMAALSLANIGRRAEAHANLHVVTPTVRDLCAVVQRAAVAEVSGDNTLAEIEADLISSLNFSALIEAFPIDGFWHRTPDPINRRFLDTSYQAPAPCLAKDLCA